MSRTSVSRTTSFDVAVVGAGVVGAATALALAREGLRVVLVEGREPPSWDAATPDLRVYAFAPDNAALLDRLGVWSAIESARSQPYRCMRVWDAAGGGELAFDADRLGRLELGWIVENALLVDRLWKALPAAGVTILCPDRVQEFSQDDSGASVGLESGTRLRARLVVAADGADSQLRQLAGIEAPTRDYGQRGLVAFIEHERPHQSTCWQRFLPTGPLAFLPFTPAAEGRHRSSIVWTLPETEAERMAVLDDSAFLGELDRAFDGPLGPLLAVSRRAAFPLRRQLASTQRQGRLVLVGDAAHVVHPLAGQGVNLGLRDVAALQQALCGGGSAGDPGAPAALQRWARTRKSESALAAGTFEALNLAFSNDLLAPTLLRGHLLGLAGRMPMLTRALWRRAAGL